MSSFKDSYKLIEKYIGEFEAEKLPLGNLIDSLQTILDGIEDNRKEWVDAFRGEWWSLEQVYAAALDRGETSLNFESRNLVHETIHNMKLLLKEVNSVEQ
ncbi:hypothetical protein [Leptolyngbya sp. 7M]|uniref:hypothetical protein n=1 Tax=Leptolyngbya sp. 7M TaxID=2812896 RepID=UPI001B8D8685|nr:hypothetical protein [Leptolyngbya sp. 7M]QYO67756.1 hypothetical protein JVX88_13785 [Leptolyngbya sp. 7M]